MAKLAIHPVSRPAAVKSGGSKSASAAASAPSPVATSSTATINDTNSIARSQARKSCLLSWQSLAAGLIVIVTANLAVYWLTHRRPASGTPSPIGRDLVLGAFEFDRPNTHDKAMYHGQFNLKLLFSEGLNVNQKKQIDRDQTRLQSAVEAGLRRVRFADFMESRLMRLKSRLLTQLNEELGFDGVADVILDDYKFEAGELGKEAGGDSTAGDTPASR